MGAYYIQRFSQLEQLEDYVKVLTQRVTEVTSKIQDLAKQITLFKTNIDTLQSDFNQAKKIIIKEEVRLKQETDDIDKTTTKLGKDVTEIEKLRTIPDVIAKERDQLKQQLDDYIAKNAQLAKIVTDLQTQVDAYSKTNSSLQINLDNAKKIIESLEKKNTDLSAILLNLESEWKLIQQSDEKYLPLPPTPPIFTATDQATQTLNQNLNGLEQSENQLENLLTRASTMVDQMHQITTQTH